MQERLLSWLRQSIAIYNTQAIDRQIYHLLNQKLQQQLNPAQWELFSPPLLSAEAALLETMAPQDHASSPAN
ncbi:hypothetical protein [Neosynechococcus sphagnicola]|uniref:hypothetical protein n=1 Tax=Neosynechococcus sphagnicola TaxID=1501145 RepID=UPI0019552E10|nr:hypothetical protein [Neosynechococcus sphagnicola]